MTPVDLVVAAAVIHGVAADVTSHGIITEKAAAKPTAKGRTASFSQRIAIRLVILVLTSTAILKPNATMKPIMPIVAAVVVLV